MIRVGFVDLLQLNHVYGTAGIYILWCSNSSMNVGSLYHAWPFATFQQIVLSLRANQLSGDGWRPKESKEPVVRTTHAIDPCTGVQGAATAGSPRTTCFCCSSTLMTRLHWLADVGSRKSPWLTDALQNRKRRPFPVLALFYWVSSEGNSTDVRNRPCTCRMPGPPRSPGK
jgi:hypothetical protein